MRAYTVVMVLAAVLAVAAVWLVVSAVVFGEHC